MHTGNMTHSLLRSRFLQNTLCHERMCVIGCTTLVIGTGGRAPLLSSRSCASHARGSASLVIRSTVTARSGEQVIERSGEECIWSKALREGMFHPVCSAGPDSPFPSRNACLALCPRLRKAARNGPGKSGLLALTAREQASIDRVRAVTPRSPLPHQPWRTTRTTDRRTARKCEHRRTSELRINTCLLSLPLLTALVWETGQAEAHRFDRSLHFGPYQRQSSGIADLDPGQDLNLCFGRLGTPAAGQVSNTGILV